MSDNNSSGIRSMGLSDIVGLKKQCVEEHFKVIRSDEVQYWVVSSWDELLVKVMGSGTSSIK